jgi:1,4-alpha-glucan branching enzyme
MAKRNKRANGKTDPANGQKQTFSFAEPTATSVQLVGDFTHWQQQPINLQKDTDGFWRTTIELPPGAHHYRFLVDGQWRDDPDCSLRVPNPYGSQDSVRQVS